MLETGIGRAHNIAMSTLPGFVLPGDVSASQRYWNEDLIEPEVQVTPNGTIQVRTAPGIGYAVRRKDRKSTRLNSSHQIISYAVFCLKKKQKEERCRLNKFDAPTRQ